MRASISEVLVVLARESDGESRPGCPFYLSLRTAALLLGVTTSSLELALREEGAPSLLSLECVARGAAWTPPRRSERAWTHLREAAFDRRVLEAELGRAGVQVPQVEWVCTKEVSKRLHPKTSHGLAPMCAQLGIPLPTHHRADCDAEACGRLLVALASQTLEARHDAVA